MKSHVIRITLWLFAISALLFACSGPSSVSSYPKVPFKGVKVGKPYKIMGKWYSPHYNPTYDEKGIASWYGPNFHGKLTANGEKYNQYAYTAAHTTLPMPSIVRVTNLANGKAMNLRVNDRGPFHEGRIIDLSKAAAQKLGVISTGVAQVRVQYLPAETERYIASKGNEGDALHYSENFASYTGAKPITQRTEKVEIEKVGKRMAAPIKEVEVETIAPIRQVYVQSSPAQSPSPSVAPIYQDLNEQNYAIKPVYRVSDNAGSRQLELPKNVDMNRVSDNGWAVQVASYSSLENARLMSQKLKKIGSSDIKQVTVNGQNFYRLLLNPESEIISRESVLSVLQNQYGISDAKIVVD